MDGSDERAPRRERGSITLRRARRNEADAVAALFRASKEAAMPYLPDLHTAHEDRAFFRDRVFVDCDVSVAERGGALVGFCAHRPSWIDHLYVHPDHQRSGVGSVLVRHVQQAHDHIRLWAFQRNVRARAFYEAHGFTCERTTDGRDNEEHEPDALYVWSCR